MNQSELPQYGVPTGGWKEYRDCHGGMSIYCNRPDCKRCSLMTAEFIRKTFAKFVGSILYLSKGRKLPDEIKTLIDHFNPTLNAATTVNQKDIDAFVEKLNADDLDVT